MSLFWKIFLIVLVFGISTALTVLAWFIYTKQHCDTWNIALGVEQKDGSMDVEYVRICAGDYENLARIIKASQNG